MIGMASTMRFICLVLCLHVACAVTEVRWCTISSQEEAKCAAMKTAFESHSLPTLRCVAHTSTRECMAAIANGDADLITLDGGDVYPAGFEFGLVPIMNEQYAQTNPDGYHAIAVVKKSNPAITIKNLRGKKSCHTGVRKTAGWNVPVGFLMESGDMTPQDCQDDITSAGNFFSQSCAPGAKSLAYDPFGTNPDSLCALCLDDCSRSSSESYYNYAGAFRCLAEDAGDVAFIKPVTITQYTDQGSTEEWARDLMSDDFELLCPDGSRAAVGSEANCNLAFVPTHAVMTSSKYISTVLADFRDVLQRAQTLFGADVNPNGFSMFDSSIYTEGSDLLFKDSTVSLKDVVDKDYTQYLGESYLATLKGLEKCPANTLRWCVTSDFEKEKCRAMSSAFEGAGFTPLVSCFQSYTDLDCVAEITNNRADLITLDAGVLYKAGRDNGVSPIMAEDYGQGDSTYWGIAVVKRDTTFTINDLKGKKSCHTGIMRTVGWIVPVGFLITRGDIVVTETCDIPQAVGEFFSESCASGSKEEKNDPDGTNPESLCALCAGEGSNKCASNAAEPYAGYAGAFRCMAEGAGDVAFVKHTTVGDNTGGTNQASWAINLKKEDYQLLCPNGTRAEIDDYMNCNLARVPSHAVVTSGDKTAADKKAMVDLLNNGQNRFKSDTGSGFKMFDSSNYTNSNNLIFKDSTVQLLDARSKDTYDKFLSKEYLEDVEAIYCDKNDGGTSSAGNLLASFLVVNIALVIRRIVVG
ncbi:melanotransferrin-like [Asterias amurensis]|uniref:melanotransferrin-like n=1 Tax=Asterias amurensis TaxID=7602 RepID=UPI003AB1C06E